MQYDIYIALSICTIVSYWLPAIILSFLHFKEKRSDYKFHLVQPIINKDEYLYRKYWVVENFAGPFPRVSLDGKSCYLRKIKDRTKADNEISAYKRIQKNKPANFPSVEMIKRTGANTELFLSGIPEAKFLSDFETLKRSSAVHVTAQYITMIDQLSQISVHPKISSSKELLLTKNNHQLFIADLTNVETTTEEPDFSFVFGLLEFYLSSFLSENESKENDLTKIKNLSVFNGINWLEYYLGKAQTDFKLETIIYY
ncbi:hypothetical protein MHBO_003375 [Bonamia ostreae]|uniref:Uncharacterized protein n=1 Tax=Bonamia ostreae TaxID=126728 RepID=A0ABV2AQ86_9EUKA